MLSNVKVNSCAQPKKKRQKGYTAYMLWCSVQRAKVVTQNPGIGRKQQAGIAVIGTMHLCSCSFKGNSLEVKTLHLYIITIAVWLQAQPCTMPHSDFPHLSMKVLYL